MARRIEEIHKESETVLEQSNTVPGKARSERPFYPDHLFREAVVAAIVLAVVMLIARYLPVPMERVADPTDTSYVPRPEWYFLFLFQMLKYFHGPLEVAGTILMPTIFVLILILLPFYDRRPEKRALKRPVAISLASITVVSVITLTVLALQLSMITLFANPQHGRKLFISENCYSCHAINGKGGTEGPDLAHEGSLRDANYVYLHFKNPQAFVKDSEMPSVDDLKDKDLKDLTAYIMSLK